MSKAEKKLTDEDYSMIQYFHREKGDVTRWCGWEEAKEHLKVEHPALWHAFQQVEISNQILDALLEKL